MDNMIDFKELNVQLDLSGGYTNLTKARLRYSLHQKDKEYLKLKKMFDEYRENSEYEIEQLRLEILFPKKRLDF